MQHETYLLADVASASLRTTLRPTWDAGERNEAAPVRARTLGGQAYTAVMSVTALRWDLPLTFVSSADRAQMAAWWAAETELLLTLDGSGTNVAGAFVRIVNEREPLPRLAGGALERWEGPLFLAEARGYGRLGGFILTDSVWGLLDQNYNVLG